MCPLGKRSACKRTPIGLDGFVLLFYFQLKQKKAAENLFLSIIVPFPGGVFTVPVAKRQYV